MPAPDFAGEVCKTGSIGKLMKLGRLQFENVLIFREFLILKENLRRERKARLNGLRIFEAEFIDSEALDFRIEGPGGDV